MRDGTVLVTGGAGYIGSHAVLALLDAGWKVVVVDNLVTGFDWAVDKRAKLVVANIEDEATIRATMRDEGVVAVMHFAGSVVVPESVSDPLKYYRNNTVASRSLIESAVASGVKHFIFSSTAATYGIPEKVPVSEDSPKVPINPYGMSKLMTEFMLRDVAAAHPINYCALRYFNVAGADPQGRSGQSTAGATHLIKIAAEAATGKRDTVSVFGTDFATEDGTGVRDYIHVVDLALGHLKALERLQAPQCTEINLGTGLGYSVLDVLKAFESASGQAVPYCISPRRAGDVAVCYADPARAERELGWKAQRDLALMCRDHWNWQKNNPNGYQ